MKRDGIVVEILRRLNSIKVANGYAFDVNPPLRNPETEPAVDLMPMTNVFEFPETTISETKRRGASQPPIYTKQFSVVMEHWYASTSRGKTTADIYSYLASARRYCRKA